MNRECAACECTRAHSSYFTSLLEISGFSGSYFTYCCVHRPTGGRLGEPTLPVGHRRVPFGRSRPLKYVALCCSGRSGSGYSDFRPFTRWPSLFAQLRPISKIKRGFRHLSPRAETRKNHFASFDGSKNILPHSHSIVGRKFQLKECGHKTN